MNRHKRGFTIVEVSLFIALSGLLMMGLIAGTGASITRQRYEDSVKDVAEYFRTAYSEVLNVSSSRSPSTASNSGENAGRSDRAVYGKLIVVGDLDTNPSKIYSYNVVGKAVSSSDLSGIGNTNNVLEVLNKLDANVFYETGVPASPIKAFEASEHIIPWEAMAQQPSQTNYENMSALILIVRSPASGTVRTYHLAGTEGGLDHYYGYSKVIEDGYGINAQTLMSKFRSLITSAPLVENEPLVMCIKSDDVSSGKRRAIQINAFAFGSSAVNILPQDEDNPCDA